MSTQERTESTKSTADLPRAPAERRQVRRALVSGALGTTIEWYDLFLYSAASALVIGPVFFPAGTSAAGQLAAFGTFAAGFVARPLGGVVFGHLGDRRGRKSALVTTMLLMGLATFGIGLLPDYQHAGLLAPVLLVALRVLQGIGIGGEWGGAVLLATENAPPGRQTVYSSWSAAGFPLGLLASTAVFSLVDYLGPDGRPGWQWRIPFLSSLLLVAVGLFVRSRITETPEFTASRRDIARVPVLEALRSRPLPVLTGALTALGTGLIVTTFSVYLVAWAAKAGPVPRENALGGLMIGAALECLLIPVWALLADRIGPHLVIFTGFVICAAAILPAPAALSSGSLLDSALLFAAALGVGHAAVYGSLAGLLTRLFPSRHRYSGLALTYQTGSTLASAGPLVAAALVGDGRDLRPVTTLFLAVMALAGAAVLLTPKANSLVTGEGRIP